MDKEHLIIQTRGKTLEDQFFLKQDKILMEQFHRMEKMKETKETLAEVSGITNNDVLEKLVALNIRPDAAACLALVPLVEVAWADGQIDEKEKTAVLQAVEKLFAKGTPDLAILDCWLKHKPGPQLLTVWEHYIQGLCEALTAEQKNALKADVVGHARQVAAAAGGFLGFGNKISDAEQKMLARLETVFQ